MDKDISKFKQVVTNLDGIYHDLSQYGKNLKQIKDPDDLIFQLGCIMKLCQRVIDLIGVDNESHKYSLRLAIIIHDSIKKIRAERFGAGQLILIQDAINNLRTCDKNYVVQLDSKLMNMGINWTVGE